MTVSSYTAAENFAGASLVVSSLGDPDGEAATTLADPLHLNPGTWVTISDFEAILEAPLPPAAAERNRP